MVSFARRLVGLALTVVLVGGIGPVPTLGDLGGLRSAEAKSKAKPIKRLRYRTSFPGVIPANPGLNLPNPNRPAYNSGTVPPLAVPRQDPILPGIGYVPQVPARSSPETYQDRVVRCTHQSGLGGLSGSQRNVYVHNCSM